MDADFQEVVSHQLGLQDSRVVRLEFVETILEDGHRFFVAIKSRFLNIERKVYLLGHNTFFLCPSGLLLVDCIHFCWVIPFGKIEGRVFIVFFHVGGELVACFRRLIRVGLRFIVVFYEFTPSLCEKSLTFFNFLSLNSLSFSDFFLFLDLLLSLLFGENWLLTYM